jgi:NADH-quinone oxidoreductase subunit M
MVLAPILVLVFWIGLYPRPFLKIMEPAVDQIVSRVNIGTMDSGRTHTAAVHIETSGEEVTMAVVSDPAPSSRGLDD